MRIARFRLIVYRTLKNVARKPEAIPRRSGGTDPMIELMFGEAKNPSPAPNSIMNATMDAYGVVASVVENRNRERLITASPVVVKGTCPYLSERRPLRGPAARGEGQPKQKARDEDRERRETAPIDRSASFELSDFSKAEVGPRGPEDPDRHVHVEESPPIEEREDDAADREPRHGAHPEGDLIDPERQAEFLRGRRVDDHCRAVREQNRGAEALDVSERDDLRRVDREARQQRADREHREPARVQPHPADDVGDAPDEQERDRAPKDVRLGNPNRLFGIRLQATGDLGQSDNHDARVDPRHEDADGRHRQDRPLVLNRNRLRGGRWEDDLAHGRPRWRATKRKGYLNFPTHIGDSGGPRLMPR